MACKNNAVLLGFDDEVITDKHASIVNFTTNKIGGKPDYPSTIKIDNPICPFCQLPRLLVVQIYAPLDNSVYHRILYLFACINPNCWNQSESWCCIRVQSLEQVSETSNNVSSAKSSFLNTTDWCQDADDWDDQNINANEENGNFVNNFEKTSDEDDESCSTEESLRAALGNMIVDDRNANIEVISGAQGAVAENLQSSPISAEIEGDEGEIVSIDTPTFPQRDINSILQETATPLPQEIQRDATKSTVLQFIPYFMSVWEEQLNNSSISDHHVRELLTEYQQKNQDELKGTFRNANTKVNKNEEEVVAEKYEKSLPAHGDRMFHHFITRIQINPGQILRYNREGEPPLLLYPLQGFPESCENCGSPKIFEFQLLPTLIRKLRLPTDGRDCVRLEFGTVLVFTCTKSCWSTDMTYVKEDVILQTEKY